MVTKQSADVRMAKDSKMAKLDIDIDYIAKLAELLQRTGLTEIELSQSETKIRVARQIQQIVDVATHVPAMTAQAATVQAVGEASAAVDLAHPGLVTSPMVGTAYIAAEPGAPPFIAVGQEVKEGATLLIVEAMKVMNQIRAPRGGRVTKIFVENAAPVEFGEPLLIIE